MTIVNKERAFEVTDKKGRTVRSFAVVAVPNGWDLMRTTKKGMSPIRSSSTEAGALEWLEVYRHGETVADHLRTVKG